jgi:Holliday junction resolvase RusA-like endonuclease
MVVVRLVRRIVVGVEWKRLKEPPCPQSMEEQARRKERRDLDVLVKALLRWLVVIWVDDLHGEGEGNRAQ